MRVLYKVIIKRGYLDEFVFEENNLREAGYIADIFLGKLVSPSDVEIRIEPVKLEDPIEEESANE